MAFRGIQSTNIISSEVGFTDPLLILNKDGAIPTDVGFLGKIGATSYAGLVKDSATDGFLLINSINLASTSVNSVDATDLSLVPGDLTAGAITATSFTGDGSALTGITDTDTTYTSSDFTHNDLTGVVANEHIDWTSASAGTIHASNYTDTDTTYSVGDGGLTEKNFTTTLKNKLDTIEYSADATDTANVTSSGALMTTGGTLTGGITVTGTVGATAFTGDGSALTGIASTIANLTDVDLTGLADNDILKWNNAGGEWVTASNSTAGATASAILPVAQARIGSNSAGTGAGCSFGAYNSSNGEIAVTFNTTQSDANYTIITDSEGYDQCDIATYTKTTTGFIIQSRDSSGSNVSPSVFAIGFIVYSSSPTQSITSDTATDWTQASAGTIHASNYTDTDTTYSVGDGGLTQINFTSADNTKLDGIEALADVTDTANVTSSGALMTTGGTMTGLINGADGTEALPMYRFATAASGMYMSGSDNIGFSQGGNKKLEITTNGIDITGDISGTGNGSVGYNIFSDWAGLQLAVTSDHYLGLKTNNTERLRIDSDGNVGIGQTSPSAVNSINPFLHIGNSSTAQSGIILEDDESKWEICHNGDIAFREGINAYVRIGTYGIQATGWNWRTVSASDPTATSNPDAPGTGVGHLWINSSSGESYVCTNATSNNNVWSNIGEGEDHINDGWGGSASGGTTSTYGSYTMHTFTSSGTFTVITGGVIDYLVVAAGGGGGSHIGGGGGAGGMLYATSYTIGTGAHVISIGGGGSGSTNTNGTAGNGGNTSFGSIATATGGGGGGSGYGTGAAGGSGGGEGHSTGASSGTPGQGTAGQGNNGGNGNQSGCHAAGGGGGKAAVGGDGAQGGPSGGGGGGELWNLDGNGYFYAGGGGGGGMCSAAGNGGEGGGGGGTSESSSGGTGGGTARNAGGNGSSNSTAKAGNGGANTGGGGGGGSHSSGDGGDGGSGIVIIRYET